MQAIPRGLEQVARVTGQGVDEECGARDVEGGISEVDLRRQCRPGLRCRDCITRNRKYWNDFRVNIEFHCARVTAL